MCVAPYRVTVTRDGYVICDGHGKYVCIVRDGGWAEMVVEMLNAAYDDKMDGLYQVMPTIVMEAVA